MSLDECEWLVECISTGKSGKRHRCQKNECLEFAVFWGDKTSTMEPIWNLVDSNNQEVTEHLVPFLCQYDIMARACPGTNRKCWFCDKKTFSPNMCKKHDDEFSWLIEIVDAKLVEIRKKQEEPRAHAKAVRKWIKDKYGFDFDFTSNKKREEYWCEAEKALKKDSSTNEEILEHPVGVEYDPLELF